MARRHDPITVREKVVEMKTTVTSKPVVETVTANRSPTSPRASAPLVFAGTTIRDHDQSLCLTDMWKAAGSPNNKDPNSWMRTEAARLFVEHVSNLNPANGRVIESKPGKGGGTWAHWHVGFAYAKYLSPAFHVWCNEIVRAVMEGRVAQVERPKVIPEAIEEMRALREQVSALVSGQTSLQAEVIDLRRRLASGFPSDGLTGEKDAKVYILGPLRALAAQVAPLIGKSFKSVLHSLDKKVRKAADHPKDGGNAWAILPITQFGQARRAIFNLQAEYQPRLDAHARRLAVKNQLTLVK